MTSILTIGEKIKKLRNEYKLNQDDIVGTELTRNLISQIEHGKANLTRSTAELIIRNTKDILEKRGTTLDEGINAEYLLETEEAQAKKVINSYIKELKEVSVYKESYFEGLLKKIDDLLIKWGFTDLKIDICEIVGDYYAHKNDFHKASMYYENIKYLIGSETDMNRIVSIFRKLSMVYIYSGNFSEGIRVCRNALERFKDMDNDYKSIFTFNMSLYYHYLGEYEKSLDILSELESVINKENKDKYGSVLLLKASCLQDLKRYAKALDIYNELLNITPKNDVNNLCIYYNNMAQVYIGMGKMEIANNYIATVVSKLVKISDDFQSLPQIYLELGRIYRMINQNNVSVKYLNKALKLAKSFKYHNVIKDVLNEFLIIDRENIDIKDEFIFLTENIGIIDNKLLYNIIKCFSELNKNKEITELCEFCGKFQ
ncbi:helix-turn-helix domain-containing protein [Clostridium felsineum]|uniref:helix-turn-helix domain-containing protein n=1 Tax=Clostridium felsineum TaxID=36839 RepID=UPI00098BFC80|nr:helix-turn-helix domain-containing protein [Clostridium felsineum]URZ02724.1 hypothetical protein CLAUR_027480 [Clostridium felsineum]